MQLPESVLEIIDAAEGFVEGAQPPMPLIRLVDAFVSSDTSDEVPKELEALLLQIQDDLALYVRDELTRNEAPEVYLNESELRVRVNAFLRTVQRWVSVDS